MASSIAGSAVREFFLPDTIAAALALKAEWRERARFVAGGTDLVLQLRALRHTPEVLIRLPLAEADPTVLNGVLRVPALTPLATLERHPLMLEHVPLLADAIGQVGSPQIRYAGTLGGNLGNASPAADSVPPLLVYEADLELGSSTGTRLVKVSEFFVGPGKTVLRADEAVVAIHIPVSGGMEVGFFRKFGPRGANVISSASFAARALVREGTITGAFLAAGSVAPRPIRLPLTEAALVGLSRREFQRPETVVRLQTVLAGEVSPISDVRGSAWYKTQVVERCLHYLCELLRPQRD
jgi:CO/xanthine dehydrogenase FAD-binding subunit